MPKHTPHMSANLIDLLRKIDDLIRIGTVTEVRSGECRVKTSGNHTNWRLSGAARGRTRRRMRPSVGEQVILLSLSGDLRNAFVLAGIYQDARPEPLADDDNGDLDRIEYPMAQSSSTTCHRGAPMPAASRSATLSASVTVKLITPWWNAPRRSRSGAPSPPAARSPPPPPTSAAALKSPPTNTVASVPAAARQGPAMNWRGMNADTGRTLSETAHILQSVRNILTTPIGTRVMRRDYGSEIFSLIDQPQHGATPACA